MKKIILTIFALNIFLVKSQSCFEDLKYKVKEAYLITDEGKINFPFLIEFKIKKNIIVVKMYAPNNEKILNFNIKSIDTCKILTPLNYEGFSTCEIYNSDQDKTTIANIKIVRNLTKLTVNIKSEEFKNEILELNIVTKLKK